MTTHGITAFSKAHIAQLPRRLVEEAELVKLLVLLAMDEDEAALDPPYRIELQRAAGSP